MKPKILVTVSFVEDEKFLRISRLYLDCIAKAGGIGIIVDSGNPENIESMLDMADGVLLTGGCDVDPLLYDENPIKEIGEVTPPRDVYELELIRLAAERDMPVLGICRGSQMINVAFGGSLYQDIFAQNKGEIMLHAQKQLLDYASHNVKLNESTKLFEIFGKEQIPVNSMHHQSVKKLGDGIIVGCFAEDGIIEAIEKPEYKFCVGVQWHPERMICRYPEQLRLFEAFIEKCKN